MTLIAPFPYFGGKRHIAHEVWRRFGSPKQFIEPFCGSAAMLLAAPKVASLEVICDMNGFIANFWRAVKHDPEAVAVWADYPVSHIDLGARHTWLMDQRERLAKGLLDADWHGDAKVAGWWLWGQCCWIGGGWCDWSKTAGQVPHVTDAGRGIQAAGRVPHVTDAGRYLTSSGHVAEAWLRKIATRLERVRIIHGDWTRALNHHYGGTKTAIFFDPPYSGFENVYSGSRSIAADVAEWALEHEHLRIAICGHIGDYDLPGWEEVRWERPRFTYGSQKTRDQECVWFSPACMQVRHDRMDLFDVPFERRIEKVRAG